MSTLMRRSCPMPHDANKEKLDQLLALRSPWRLATHALRDILLRRLQAGEPLLKRMSTKDLPFETVLSARQVSSVYNQVYQNLAGWLGLTEHHARDMITLSNLPSETKIILYRLNKRRAWAQKSMVLPMWVHQLTGEVYHSEKEYITNHKGKNKKESLKDCTIVDEPVNPDILRLYRKIVKQVHKTKARIPRFKKLNTLLLDGTIAMVEAGDNTYGYWLRISTLNWGKPVLIPLKKNPYFDNMSGKLAQFVQLKIMPDNQIEFKLQKKMETPPDTLVTSDENGIIGLDYGMTDGLFSDSKGNHHGQAFLTTMKKKDKELSRLTAALESQNIRLSTNKRYKKLQASMSSYAKNEINRLLNKISTTHHTIILEKLDFRNGGLSKRLNRLITRLGRGAIKQKLASLAEENRIVYEEVISAYSSQECSGCGYVNKKNRKTRSRFECGFCGKTIHSDTNASRTVKGRRSTFDYNDSTPSTRRFTRSYLDTLHRSRWGLPVMTAVNGTYRVPTRAQTLVKLL